MVLFARPVFCLALAVLLCPAMVQRTEAGKPKRGKEGPYGKTRLPGKSRVKSGRVPRSGVDTRVLRAARRKLLRAARPGKFHDVAQTIRFTLGTADSALRANDRWIRGEVLEPAQRRSAASARHDLNISTTEIEFLRGRPVLSMIEEWCGLVPYLCGQGVDVYGIDNWYASIDRLPTNYLFAAELVRYVVQNRPHLITGDVFNMSQLPDGGFERVYCRHLWPHLLPEGVKRDTTLGRSDFERFVNLHNEVARILAAGGRATIASHPAVAQPFLEEIAKLFDHPATGSYSCSIEPYTGYADDKPYLRFHLDRAADP